MQTVRNVEHYDPWSDEVNDQFFDGHAVRLEGWHDIAQASWHLDSVHQIGSVILRTIRQQFQFQVEVIDEANESSKVCTYVSESVDFRQINFDCDADGDLIKISETSGRDLLVSRLIIFQQNVCIQDVLDNLILPNLEATIDGSPVTQQLFASGVCETLTYEIEEASLYSWL